MVSCVLVQMPVKMKPPSPWAKYILYSTFSFSIDIYVCVCVCVCTML